jgi:cell division protein FtsL
MNANKSHSYGLSLFIKKALEGKIGPMNFILLLGFVSSLLLLYISLHFYFFNISEQIELCTEREKALMNESARLLTEYNDLASPERIIPLAKKLRMRASMPEEVERLAVFEDGARDAGTPAWARADIDGTDDSFDGMDRRAR